MDLYDSIIKFNQFTCQIDYILLLSICKIKLLTLIHCLTCTHKNIKVLRINLKIWSFLIESKIKHNIGLNNYDYLVDLSSTIQL